MPSTVPAVYCSDSSESAWNLGHAEGLAGKRASLPGHFGYLQYQNYSEGWRAGDAERILAIAERGRTLTDEAWWSGFSLGIDGIPANPSDDLSPAERVAFGSGHDAGHARFVEDCEAEHAEWLDRLDSAFGDTGVPDEAEINWALSRRVAVGQEGGVL